MSTWSSFSNEKQYTDKWRTFLEEGYKEETAFCDKADKEYEAGGSIEQFPVDRCGHPSEIKQADVATYRTAVQDVGMGDEVGSDGAPKEPGDPTTSLGSISFADAPEEPEEEEEEDEGVFDNLKGLVDSVDIEKIEAGLDVAQLAGMTGWGEAIATPAAIASLTIDLYQQDWDSALINLIALTPVVGKAAKAASMGAKGAKTAKALQNVAKAADLAKPLVAMARSKQTAKGEAVVGDLVGDLAAGLVEKLPFDVEQFATMFDEADALLKQLATVPVVGGFIKEKIEPYTGKLNAIRQAVNVLKNPRGAAGEMADKYKRGGQKKVAQGQATAVPTQQLSKRGRPARQPAPGQPTSTSESLIFESTKQRWQQLAGINTRVL
jgi:hypothetical protein